jgi:hypothetical protein
VESLLNDVERETTLFENILPRMVEKQRLLTFVGTFKISFGTATVAD